MFKVRILSLPESILELPPLYLINGVRLKDQRQIVFYMTLIRFKN